MFQCDTVLSVASLPLAMAFKVVSVVLLFAFILAVNFIFYLPLKSESRTNYTFMSLRYDEDATEDTSDTTLEFSSTIYTSTTGSLQPEENFEKVQSNHKIIKLCNKGSDSLQLDRAPIII